MPVWDSNPVSEGPGASRAVFGSQSTVVGSIPVLLKHIGGISQRLGNIADEQNGTNPIT
jgi:hypothetical protein